MDEAQEKKKFEAEQNSETSRTLVNLDAVLLSKCVLSLPIIGFVTCIALSIFYDFDQATATHCKVLIP